MSFHMEFVGNNTGLIHTCSQTHLPSRREFKRTFLHSIPFVGLARSIHGRLFPAATKQNGVNSFDFASLSSVASPPITSKYARELFASFRPGERWRILTPSNRRRQPPSPPWNGGEGWGEEELIPQHALFFLRSADPLPGSLPLCVAGEGEEIGSSVKMRTVSGCWRRAVRLRRQRLGRLITKLRSSAWIARKRPRLKRTEQ